MKVLYTNADCFTISKQTELGCHIQNNKPDIIAITEVLPKHHAVDISASQYAVDGYNMFCSDVTQGRGCIIYVKSAIPASCVNIGVFFLESVWCRIDLAGSDKLLLGCVYRRPNSTIDNNQKLLNLFARVNEINLSHSLIMGDFNIKEIDWKKY